MQDITASLMKDSYSVSSYKGHSIFKLGVLTYIS